VRAPCGAPAARRELGLALGATIACAPDGAARAVREESAELGADAVFDTVGGTRALRSSLDLLRAGGTAVLFAHAPAGERADVEINAFFKSERRVVPTYSGALAEQDRVWELLCDGSLDPAPLVSHRFALDEFDEAVRCVREHEGLKVLLEPRGAGAR